MKILALELSTARGGIAWMDDEAPAFLREFPNDRKDSGLFFENLQSGLEKCGGPESIIVGLGPGSYAGVRIAIATATGLHAARGGELFGIPSISAIASDVPEYCVIGDARRQSFYFARVRANGLSEGPDLFSEDELRKKLETLDQNTPIFTSEKLPQFDRAEIRYPSALVLAGLAQELHQNVSLPPLEPIYLRTPHITMPRSPIAL